MLPLVSVLGLLVMIAALAGQYLQGCLFAHHPVGIAVQVLAVALMVWARLTFGLRSFHASAGPTSGGLVTTGPYRYVRHPIYTAACVFGWAGIANHASPAGLALGIVLIAGGLARMLSEERLVTRRYPEYAAYAHRTKRMIPFLF